jgi:hypothetical protein
MHAMRVIAMLILLALVNTARADYESQRWYIGEYPHRIGVVGINDQVTQVCLGEERVWVDWAFGPYYLHIHPYAFLGIVSTITAVPIVLVALFFRRRYRRRHENAA